MYISAAHSFARRFSKSWEAHHPGNDNDEPGGATPIAIAEPPSDDREAMEDPPHQLRLASAVGTVVLKSSAAVLHHPRLPASVPSISPAPEPRPASRCSRWHSSRRTETASRRRRGREAVEENFERRRAAATAVFEEDPRLLPGSSSCAGAGRVCWSWDAPAAARTKRASSVSYTMRDAAISALPKG